MKNPPAILAILLAVCCVALRAEDDAARAASLSAEAEAFAAAGDHRAAAAALEKAAGLAPSIESLRFRLGAQKAFLREYSQAEAIFRELAASPNPELADMARNSLDALRKERAASAAPAISPAQRAAQQRREREFRAREADLAARQRIYDRFLGGDDAGGLALLRQYQAAREAPAGLRFAGVYALLRERLYRDAAAELDGFPEEAKHGAEWLLTRGRVSRALGKNADAWREFRESDHAAPATDFARQAREEMRMLPRDADPNRWAWGELQIDAVYMYRFDDTIFYGALREGTYVPGARWIQPFVQLGFALDTKSGLDGSLSQVFANNLAGGHLGVRIRPLENESLWLYGLVGVEKDLRGTTRYDGAWFFDWRVGARGYKGFGPGLNFLQPAAALGEGPPSFEFRPRLAWLAEAGADAAYYSLYENLIAYYQVREGFRVLEIGSWQAFDLYALQQGGLDSEGLYYNNFFEFGGGVRAVTNLAFGVQFVARAEYLGGVYLGRNTDNSRGALGSSYKDFRITASLWAEW